MEVQMDDRAQKKMQQVKAILKALEEMIQDHVEDADPSEPLPHALDMVESAIETYVEFEREGEIIFGKKK